MITFIPDNLIYPKYLLKQHHLHHLMRVGEGAETDFLVGTFLNCFTNSVAAAYDEDDVAFTGVHPPLVFFRQIFTGISLTLDFQRDDMLIFFDFTQDFLRFFVFYDFYIFIACIVWFFLILDLDQFEFGVAAYALTVFFDCMAPILLF